MAKHKRSRDEEDASGGEAPRRQLKQRLSPNSFAEAARAAAASASSAAAAAAACAPDPAAALGGTGPGERMVAQLQARLAELRDTLRSSCGLDGSDACSAALDALEVDVLDYVAALGQLPAWTRVQRWFDEAHAIVARELGASTPRSGEKTVESAIHENFDALKGLAEGDWIGDLTAKLSKEWASAARGSDSAAAANIRAFHERVLEARENQTAERSLDLLFPVLEGLDVSTVCNASREERVSLIFQSCVHAVWSEVTTNWLPETLPIADQQNFRGLWLSDFRPPAGLSPELLWTSAEAQQAAAALSARTGTSTAASTKHLEICGYGMPAAIRLAVPGLAARLRGTYVASGGLLGSMEIEIDLEIIGDLEILLRLNPYRNQAKADAVSLEVEVAGVEGRLSQSGTSSLRSGVVGTLQNIALGAVSRVMYPYLEQWGAEVGLRFSRKMIDDWLNTPLAPMLTNAQGLLSITGDEGAATDPGDNDQGGRQGGRPVDAAPVEPPRRRPIRRSNC